MSVAPDESIDFMVSSAHLEYHVEIVRLIHGDTNPLGPGFKEVVVDSSVAGDYPGRVQEIKTGSSIEIPDAPALKPDRSFTLAAWILATMPGVGIQGLISTWNEADHAGYGLVLDETGAVSLWLGGETEVVRVSSDKPLNPGVWYQIAASFDAERGEVTLIQRPSPIWPLDPSHVTQTSQVQIPAVRHSNGLLIIGAIGAVNHFNGKIDSPLLLNRALMTDEIQAFTSGSIDFDSDPALIARWDFSQEISSSLVIDRGPNGLHGTAINLPTRGVTGHNWSGDEVNHRHSPGEYGAIHFHSDDLDDVGWEVSFSWLVPANLKSGVYATRLTCGDDEDYLPFVVRPPRSTATAKIAYLISTFTYLAYANEHVPPEPVELYPFLDRDAHLDEYRYIAENKLHSMYDVHADGSGVCYASWKRPMVNTRPKATFRIYSSPERLGTDLYLVDWLENFGFDYDAIADEQIHEEGIDILQHYNVLVTGCHPEYWTAPMMAALDGYITAGGRVMYLGGNGFYWVTGVDPERPHVIEIRRWRGTETWEASPGEYHLSTTGELGGLWRNRNRAPQKLLGVGFTSQGNDFSRPYVRQPESHDPRAAFIFEGIEDETIGDFQSLMLRHGAAGYEIDRADRALGTPPHALVLATAAGFSNSYQHVIEEVLSTDEAQGGPVDPLVRADIVFFEGPQGGAVFSVGSIAWLGALSFNHHQNNVSRMTRNVLTRFASDEPILPPADQP